MPFRLAMICVLLPLCSVHLTWLIAASLGHLPFCLPYWSHCHSISATGRGYPEFFVFKALIIPTAVFMLAYWLLTYRWLIMISKGELKPKLLTILGLIACVALIIYAVTLGALGETYSLARRIGVVFYFAFSAFAHLLLLSKLQTLNLVALGLQTRFHQLYRLCTVLVISAIASAGLGFLWEGWDAWENAYEWWFSLFMIAQFYLVGCMWKRTAFELTFSVKIDV